MRKQVLSFTIEPDLDDFLREKAEEQHLSVSQFIRNLIWSVKEIDEFSNRQEAKELVEKHTHTFSKYCNDEYLSQVAEDYGESYADYVFDQLLKKD